MTALGAKAFPDDPATRVKSDADADDLPTFEDHRVSFEATEAQSSMDATHAFPVGIPRRVMKARLRE